MQCGAWTDKDPRSALRPGYQSVSMKTRLVSVSQSVLRMSQRMSLLWPKSWLCLLHLEHARVCALDLNTSHFQTHHQACPSAEILANGTIPPPFQLFPAAFRLSSYISSNASADSSYDWALLVCVCAKYDPQNKHSALFVSGRCGLFIHMPDHKGPLVHHNPKWFTL